MSNRTDLDDTDMIIKPRRRRFFSDSSRPKRIIKFKKSNLIPRWAMRKDRRAAEAFSPSAYGNLKNISKMLTAYYLLVFPPNVQKRSSSIVWCAVWRLLRRFSGSISVWNIQETQKSNMAWGAECIRVHGKTFRHLKITLKLQNPPHPEVLGRGQDHSTAGWRRGTT